MSDLQSSTQQHCFARLKARTLTRDEIENIAGGVSSNTVTGVEEIEQDGDGGTTIYGRDGHED